MQQNPALARFRIRTELRRSREACRLTQRQVAAALDWHPSKVIRIENGGSGISTTDVRALAAMLKIDDRVDQLVEWAKASRRQPFAEYADVLSDEARFYFGYEASAKRIRQFEPNIVPGLLQTPDYTRTLLRQVYGLPDEKIEKHVEIREQRQQVLAPPMDERQAFFMLDEAVIRRPVGGNVVMRGQLDHLTALAQQPGITIQVLPFRAGAHFGLRGAFVYLEFFDAETPNVLYLENAAGGDQMIKDDARQPISPYRDAFQTMERELASPTSDTDHWLKKATKALDE